MDAFIGEIRALGFAWTPPNWLPCDGRSLPLTGSDASYGQLFSVIGTLYGGDGVNDFNIPDLRGVALPGMGQGARLNQNYEQGVTVGSETVQLTVKTMPEHTHTLSGQSGLPTVMKSAPSSSLQVSRMIAIGPPSQNQFTFVTPSQVNQNNLVAMNAASITPTGSGNPHTNIQPVLVLQFCICYSSDNYPYPG